MSNSFKLAIKYSICALIATIANIATQDLVTRLYDGNFVLSISMIAGTTIGLVIKYVLDKRYIFHFQPKSSLHSTQTFFLYTIVGIFTTIVFLLFEFGFDYFFQSKEMRYLGGVIGLVIGYLTKFHLDKRYVF